LIEEQLRAVRADIASVKEDTREIKSRLIIVESGIASLRRDGGDFAASIADQRLRHDRMNDRINRIEKRLERNRPAVPPVKNIRPAASCDF
jgi:septal ring factor EnvC (AmiA/AmiB activator)